MLSGDNQYVNIHAHRCAAGKEEWVLRSLKSGEYPPDPVPGAVYSVGMHPWEIGDTDIPPALKKVRMAVENPRVLAIGEIGLDRFADVPEELQMRVFGEQVELAGQMKMPVIIHAVKSYSELIRFSRTAGMPVPMIIHGYRGSLQMAEDLLGHGYYLSFGEPLLESDKVREVFGALPLDRLFLETDESEAPIAEIYRAAAEIKEISTGSLLLHMVQKVRTIFPGR